MKLKASFIICFCLNLTNSQENIQSDGIHDSNLFYLKLYKALNRQGNFVFSPVSVETSMYLAYDGSQGTTSNVIHSVVWPSSTETPRERHSNLTRTLRSSEFAIFLEPNKIYVSDLLNLSSTYIDAVERKYLTDVTRINFSNRQEVATAINNWVANVTNTQIKDLLSKTDFDLYQYTSVLMLSCVDFTGVWSLKFKDEDMKLEPFYFNENDCVDTPMMHMNNENFDVLENDKLDAKILVLPFADKNYILTIFLPNNRSNIEGMKDKLFASNIPVGEFVKNTTTRTVNIALPKFRIESTLDLKDPLSKVGLGDLFSTNANFSGMIDKPNRFNDVLVNNIIQKSYLEINEVGVEGAIGTVGKLCEKRAKRSANNEPIDFIANHPFLFFILAGDKENSYVDVFSGQVYKP